MSFGPSGTKAWRLSHGGRRKRALCPSRLIVRRDPHLPRPCRAHAGTLPKLSPGIDSSAAQRSECSTICALPQPHFAESMNASATGPLLSPRRTRCSRVWDQAQAAEALRELERLSARKFVTSYGVALAHGGLGQNDAAFASLKTMLSRSNWLVWLRLAPVGADYASIHDLRSWPAEYDFRCVEECPPVPGMSHSRRFDRNQRLPVYPHQRTS
jgi:hypothetical protein